jgi:hypothetical protein
VSPKRSWAGKEDVLFGFILPAGYRTPIPERQAKNRMATFCFLPATASHTFLLGGHPLKPKTRASDIPCLLTIVPCSSSTDSLELQQVLQQSLEFCLFLYISTGSIFLARSVPGSRLPECTFITSCCKYSLPSNHITTST